MKNKLNEFAGKKIWMCTSLGKRLDLNPMTVSICHEVQNGNRIIGKIEELSPDFFYDNLYELTQMNMKEDGPCRGCSKCIETIYEMQPISYVTVNTSWYCNSSCIYCEGHFGQENTGYNPLDYLKLFYEENLFHENCYFDWGGGEPTLNPYFEDTVQWLYEHGFYQRINTNAIIYSEVAEQALKQKAACMRISVDSGTEEGFRIMKGHDNYDKVWENIKKYCTVTDDIHIKYNVCNYNSDEKEIIAFLDKCQSSGVKKIIIDAEIASYQPSVNAGPFYFRKKEFDAAHLLQKEAKERGFYVEISTYAYSVRAEYDDSGALILPTRYYDNINKEIVSADIGVKTFPNLRHMLKVLEKQDSVRAIWGMGEYGKKCYKLLCKKGINVDYLVDQSAELQKNGYCGKTVISPEEFFALKVPATVILVGIYWQEMLKQINDNRYDSGDIIYMKNIYYDMGK